MKIITTINSAVVKFVLVLVIALLAFNSSNAQNIAINLSGNPGSAAAIVDLSDASNNRLGFLFPNVSLSAYNSTSPVTSPPDGLVVYNTNASMTGGFGVGLYYWSMSATQWYYITNSGTTAGGDLSGAYPNPTVAKIKGNTIPVNAAGALTNNGSGTLSWVSYLTANQAITLTGAVTGSGTTSIATTLASGVVGVSNLSASGTASNSTYLRGDNTWATIPTYIPDSGVAGSSSITVTAAKPRVVSINSTYPGQTSITTLGTIGTGTWQGSSISAAYLNDSILIGGANTTISRSASGITINSSNPGGTVTSYSAGNFSPLFTTSVATATSTPALSFAPVSQSANLFFGTPNASGNPSFITIYAAALGTTIDTTITHTAGANNELAYYTGTNSLAPITAGANGVLVTSAINVPSISSTLPSAVQGNITGTGTLLSGATGAGFTLDFGSSTLSGIIPATNGGTGVNNGSNQLIIPTHGTAVLGNGGASGTLTGWQNADSVISISVGTGLSLSGGTLTTASGAFILDQTTSQTANFDVTGPASIGASGVYSASNMLTVAGASVNGVVASTSSASGYGLEGTNTATSGSPVGILGIANGTGATGIGVQGNSTVTGGTGVEGTNSASSGASNTFAVQGLSTSTGTGSNMGINASSTGTNTGTNIGGQFAASGATNNYAIIVPSASGSVGIGTSAPLNMLDVNGSFGTGITTPAQYITTGTVLTAASLYNTIIATPSAVATYSITLPQASLVAHRIYTITYNGTAASSGGNYAINITANAADKINLNGSLTGAGGNIPLNSGSISLQCDGTNWDVIGLNAGIDLANNGLNLNGTAVQLGAASGTGNALGFNTYIYQATAASTGYSFTHDFGTVSGTANTSGSAFAIQNTSSKPYFNVGIGAMSGSVGIGNTPSTGYLFNVSTAAAGATGKGDSILIQAQGGNGANVGGGVRLFGGTGGAAGNGGTMIINGGAGNTTGTGGAASVLGGAGGATGAGGAANIIGGAGGSSSGNAGGVSIAGGVPVSGNGGAIAINGSSGVGGTSAGGAVSIQAGTSVGATAGGNASLAGGTGGATGAGGTLTLSSGSAGGTGPASGGAVLLNAGTSSGNANGASVTIQSAAATGSSNNNGGNILLIVGTKTGTGTIGGVSINTTGATPSAAAVLDLTNSVDLGFQGPTVALTATDKTSPLAASASPGLMVYNSNNTIATQATSADTNVSVAPGYYYNGGTAANPRWVRMGPSKFTAQIITNAGGVTTGATAADYVTPGYGVTAAQTTLANIPTGAFAAGAATEFGYVATSACELTAVNLWVENNTTAGETATFQLEKYTFASGATNYTGGVTMATGSVTLTTLDDYYNLVMTLASPTPAIAPGDVLVLWVTVGAATKVLHYTGNMEFQSY